MKIKIPNQNKLSFFPAVLLLAILMLLSPISKGQEDKDFETVKQLDIFYSLYKELDLFYVDELDPSKTIRIAIDAMLEEMDPYTVYLPEDEIEDLRFMTTGEYGGIGALIRMHDDYIAISEPYEGFPAQKAGLKAGDLIISIDGKDVKNKTTAEVSELLKGQPGTTVKLTIRRQGSNELLNLTITREEIKVPSVPYYELLDGNIAYIQLSSFTNTATSEVRDAYTELSQNRELKGVILDLRGNPGGLLIEAVKICNLFLEKDVLVVSTKGKVEQWDKEYKTTESPLNANIPLVILVNSGSASASEIVSGCMQDLDRGVIIGQRTYGKGLVQTTRDLSYNSKLKVTTAKYYIPSGRCIQALDYSHRNEDGSVGRVPDSLVSEFATRNGRKVYDGGGVLPDIVTEPEKLANITGSLIMKNFIFDYATQFVVKHESIAGAKGFTVDDAIYSNFVTYLSDKDFDYQTESEELLNNLIEATKEEKYFSVSEQELEALRLKLGHDKNKDLQVFKQEISEILGIEIVHRYYYQKGKIQYQMKYDEELSKAIEVISNPETYKSILGVEQKKK